MESASVVVASCVKALSGTALAPVAEVDAFAVVPATVPPRIDDDPWVLAVPASTEAGAVRTPDPGVYFVELVSALDPADADADDENDVAAPAPLAPLDALL